MKNESKNINFEPWSIDRKRSKKSSPYPHIIIDNFLPSKLIDNFLNEIKDDDNFFEHFGWKGKRVSVRFGTKEYEDLIEKSKSFSEIHNLLNTKDAIKGLYKWFEDDITNTGLKTEYHDIEKIDYKQDKTEFSITSNLAIRIYHRFFLNPIIRKYNLRRYFRRFMRIFSAPSIYPLFSYSQSTGGYVEPDHTDSRHKVFICLIYLDDLDEGGSLVIKRNKKEKPLSECEMYPPPEELEAGQVVPTSRNRFVCFINQNNAYHSTLPFIGLRRFIYFAYAVSNEETAFETDYTVRLGDAGRQKRV
ncbi:hypothetical protein N9425_02685 [Gammaproteobacteria bacterium]|nr:hypothetical protein [Gammaproteobacteria bacterium]